LDDIKSGYPSIPRDLTVKKLQKSNTLTILILVILTGIVIGSILLYREWRGNQIVFIGDYHGEKNGIYRLNLMFGKPILIASGPIATPRWSPDGNRIAFITSGDENGGPPYHIALMGNNGDKIQQLTEGEVRQYSPTWSPDGKEIAFIFARDYKGGSPMAIFAISVDGSAQRQITPYAFFNDLSWSPDGSRIAYSTFQSISVINADGSSNQQLTDQYTDSFPVWSPNGQYIAFQSERGDSNDHFDIYVMRSDGTDIRRLTSSPAHDRSPSWSPDGKRIVFESNRDSDDWIYHIYSMNADGTEQKRLVEMESQSPVWRP
jgi:Tol biopolymer transport system component